MIRSIEKTKGRDESQTHRSNVNATYIRNERAFSIGGDGWKEVPDGEHIAVCSKVMPDFKWRGIPKCMVYFTVNEGEYHGYRARLAYNYNKDPTGPTFSKYSKYAKDVTKLFPDKFNDLSKEEIFDPIELYEGSYFKITTKQINGNAMVQNIDRDDPVDF